MTMQVSDVHPVALEQGSASAHVGVHVFPAVSKLLHWLVAALVLTMFTSGVMMKQIGDGAVADALYTFHKACGVGLLALVLLRLVYRIVAQIMGRWRAGAGSHAVHGVLYAGLIVVPLLGWAGISDYGARTIYFGWALPAIWPEGAGHAELLFRSHAVLAFSLIGLVAVHIGLALGDYVQRGASRAAFATTDRRD
jgi:cytochrome b561